ncbi:GDSL esterase/lipase 5 [Silene latifolia]|uniref:GDSL esterase/lipase 5 n=1 Tax=Silene latifolia TaxID=37657 RepID=UPI003D786038
MKLEYHILSSLCVLIISYISYTSCLNLPNHHHHSKHNPPCTFFIFGDSILDVGNNNYINTSTLDQANFWPYGINFLPVPTGRFSDGRLISDFIAERAHLPLIPPYLQPGLHQFSHGVNFASAGAGALVETFRHSVIDLHMQVRNYKEVAKWYKDKYGDVKARKILRNGVYLFSIGTNDYMSLYLTNSTLSTIYTKPQYVSMVITNITSVVTEIYKIGGRKFGFLNVPAIGCAPSLRLIANANGECLKDVVTYTNLHNEAIFQALQQLTNKLPGFKFSLYDFYTSTLQRIKHPSKYGYKEAKTACCGTGKYRGVLSCGGKRIVKQYELCKNIDEHLFWDSIHFTQKTYMQIANEMWNNTNYVHASHGSYTIKDLFYLR